MFDQVEVTPYRTIVSKSRSPGSNGITRATAERTFIVPICQRYELFRVIGQAIENLVSEPCAGPSRRVP
jgi:hypothetical protein